MAELAKYIDEIRVPANEDKIYKDESVYDFDTPESDNGLYICLKTFYGVSKKFLELHHSRTQSQVYLNIKMNKIEIKEDSTEEKPTKITKLAIGVEGGFQVDKKNYDIKEQFKVVVYPEFKEYQTTDPDIPEKISQSVKNVISSESAYHKEQLANQFSSWDGEERPVTQYAYLEQLERKVELPPQKDWVCMNCDKRDNLWLNLTDGAILCGRKNYDGSGGNNHAFEYYQKTKFPLAVKLGTITPDGADVYSYPEDAMVIDPNLDQHLAHFGIKTNQMIKTDKTMAELEIDANMKFGEWLLIQESKSNLVPLYGPGYTGLENIGNSCYLASVCQVLLSIEKFRNNYLPVHETIYKNSADPFDDLDFQLAKLAYGIYSPYYSIKPSADQPTTEQKGIKPTSFKSLVGKGHPEFSTKRQQDAQEFFLHIIELLDKNHKKTKQSNNPSDLFRFKVEDRTQCLASNKVNYVDRGEYVLSLPIPLDKASNLEDVSAYLKEKEEAESSEMPLPDVVRSKIKLSDCLDQFASEEIIDDYMSTATKQKTQAKKTYRIKTYPDYLMLHMKKFTLDHVWQPKKLDCSIEVPDIIDLAYLRAKGLQPNEELLPENNLIEHNFDENLVASLVEMGFTTDACKRALFRTKATNLDAALNWLFDHQEDLDFNAPIEQELTKKSTSKKSTKFVPNEEGLTMLISMGLTEANAIRCLKESNNNVEAAVEWYFANPDKLNEPESPEAADDNSQEDTFKDGSEKYKLVAFISHMGTSAQCGHYVCHIMKDDKWVIYNDNKVALSENPPRDLAYMYLFKRI